MGNQKDYNKSLGMFRKEMLMVTPVTSFGGNFEFDTKKKNEHMVMHIGLPQKNASQIPMLNRQGFSSVNLKVLRDARVSLLWEDGWVLNACISSCRYISDHGLLRTVCVVAIRAWLVVRVFGVIFLRWSMR